MISTQLQLKGHALSHAGLELEGSLATARRSTPQAPEPWCLYTGYARESSVYMRVHVYMHICIYIYICIDICVSI